MTTSESEVRTEVGGQQKFPVFVSRGEDKVTVLLESYRSLGIKLPFFYEKVTVLGRKLPFFIGSKLPFFRVKVTVLAVNLPFFWH